MYGTTDVSYSNDCDAVKWYAFLPGLTSSNVIVLHIPDLGMEYVMSVKMNYEIFEKQFLTFALTG